MTGKKAPSDIVPPTTPEKAAEVAQLRYVSDHEPGIQRKRRGRSFSYYTPEGSLITDRAERKRLEAIGIPPAWTDVWICPRSNGHILATGRDAKGRKQYIYHPRWREVRDLTKFSRMVSFGEALPLIHERTEHDLRRHGLPREKVLALVVRLLETTLIRIGNDEYARQNDSFGLTTLRDKHVRISGSQVKFQFWGKSGKKQLVELNDRRLSKIIKKCKEIPGYELFQYIDENGERQFIDSGDVNNYLRDITGQDFTAKDFRTWGGTLLALRVLVELGPSETKTETKHNLSLAVKAVASQLGNTTAVCRKYYIHPAVLERYQEGTLFEILENHEHEREMSEPEQYSLSEEEALAISFLRQHSPAVLKSIGENNNTVEDS